MTTKTKYAVKINGKTFTRTSDHEYTHTVIAPSAETYDSAMVKARDGDNGASWWDVCSAIVADGIDRNYIGLSNATRFVSENPDRAECIASRRSRAIANVEKNNAKGLYGWQPVSWHRSETLARKAIKSYFPGSRVISVGSDIKID